MLTIPNLISLVRLALVPVFLWLVFAKNNVVGAGWLLGLIGSTDWIDGYLARRLGQVSKVGEFLDPLADRLAVAAAVVAGLMEGILPAWFAWGHHRQRGPDRRRRPCRGGEGRGEAPGPPPRQGGNPVALCVGRVVLRLRQRFHAGARHCLTSPASRDSGPITSSDISTTGMPGESSSLRRRARAKLPAGKLRSGEAHYTGRPSGFSRRCPVRRDTRMGTSRG